MAEQVSIPNPKKDGRVVQLALPKTTSEFFPEVRVPPVRSTPLTVLNHCRRKFLYEYKWGIHPKMLERALTMGSFVHTILQNLYLGKTEAESLEAATKSLEKHKADLVSWADKAGFLPNGADLRASLDSLEVDFNKAQAMSICFWRFVPFNPDKWEVLLDPDGNPMIERVLELQVEGLDTVLRCPCDLVLKNKATGNIWIVDFKTSSFDPKVRAIPTKFSTQLKLYRLVLQAHLDKWGRGEKVMGSYHAIIKKPTIKMCGKDEKNADEWKVPVLEAYIRRVVKEYEKAEEADPTNPPMIRDENTFRGPLLDSELWDRLVAYSKDASHEPDLAHFFRAGEYSCLDFNRPCPYMALCSSDPVMWPQIIREHYMLSFREDEEDSHA